MKTYLVTGAAGFLGYHLSQKILRQGDYVIGLDNFVMGSRENVADLAREFPERFYFVEHDVTEPWTFKSPSGFPAVTHVAHLASIASPDFFNSHCLEILRANSIGLQLALQYANAADARLVFASTSEIYGDLRKDSFAETDWGLVNSFGPRASYDESKRFGEAMIYASNLRYKTRHGLVRIFNTYGPRMNVQDGRVVQNFILSALKNQPLKVYGDGKQTRSFCFVSDLVEGFYAYMQRDLAVPINIGNDQEITILQLADSVKKILTSSSPIEFLPARDDDPIRRKPDLKKAINELAPWKPIVTLENGLRLTAEFLKTKL